MQYTQLSRRSAGGKIDWEKQYLTFIPVEDAVFSWAERATSGHLEYSLNGGQTWVTIADGESTPTIAAGSKVIWRGDLRPTYSASDATIAGIGTFSASGNYHAYGNTMSLLFYNNYYDNQLEGNEFRCAFLRLFYNDDYILTAPELPATKLAPYCYDQMFSECTSLTTAPELPATKLTSQCYLRMFQGCTNLVTAPELPATKLTSQCYLGMFKGCTNLVTAPELPATKLITQCYMNMFYGCTSLVTAPELPATTLASDCYVGMFQGCTNLVTAPELLATTLAHECYTSMFSDCTSLVYVKMLATDISANKCLYNWLLGVASTGTFVKHSQMTTLPTGASGIPDGWEVIDDPSTINS